MKTELTIEQGQRLIELGINANKASKEIATTIGEQEYSDPRHPIFTLTDLLGILPKNIVVDGMTLNLTIEWQYTDWCVFYIRGCNTTESFNHAELIDALYELTIWLIENKFLQP